MTTLLPTGGSQGPSAPSQSNAHKQPRVLACVLCQHRKIKCDRNMPCSNCIKANVTCTPSTPAPVRKRRRPNQDLQERLARCEALLKQYASASGPLPPSAVANANAAANAVANNTGNTRAVSSSSSTAGGPFGPGSQPLPQDFESQTSAAGSPTLPSIGSNPAQSATPAHSTQSTANAATPTSSEEETSATLSKTTTGKLVVEDGSVKFMDSYLWSKLHDNLQEMKEILEAEPEEASPFPQDVESPDENVDLLLSDFSAIDIDDVVPSPVQIFRLWQVFLERVNPVTKLVHVPTLQPIVIEAAANHRKVAHNTQALLFAVYLVSVLSMTKAEAKQMLDMTKDEAFKKFTAGLKSSLIKVNFLKNYDLVTLQALVLYLISLQGRYDRHASWILSGVAIRIAHKMGFHRDGDNLGLVPFEAEMRRRVWWQIVMLDSKYALVSGFTDTTLPGGWDTKLPHNINDTNIFPGSTEIVSQEGPTEMAFCLILYEFGAFMKEHKFHNFERFILAGQAIEPDNPSYAQAKEMWNKCNDMVNELDLRVQAVEKRIVDPASGPLHTLAANFRPSLMEKVHAMMQPVRELPEWGTDVKNIEDNFFRVLLLHHESNIKLLECQEHKNFMWLFKAHFHIEHFLYLPNNLYSKYNLTCYAERSWRVIDKLYDYHEEFWDMSQKQNQQLASIVLRAWRSRERSLSQMCNIFDVPRCIPRLQDLCPAPASESSSAGPSSGQPMKMELGGLGSDMPNNGISAPSAVSNYGVMGPGGTIGTQPVMPDPSSMDFMSTYLDSQGLDWDLFTDLNNQPLNDGHMSGAAPPNFGPFSNFGAPPNAGRGW